MAAGLEEWNWNCKETERRLRWISFQEHQMKLADFTSSVWILLSLVCFLRKTSHLPWVGLISSLDLVDGGIIYVKTATNPVNYSDRNVHGQNKALLYSVLVINKVQHQQAAEQTLNSHGNSGAICGRAGAANSGAIWPLLLTARNAPSGSIIAAIPLSAILPWQFCCWLVVTPACNPRLMTMVDGMDALAVKQACKFAKEFALRNGPIILEMDTYRYHGHSMSDPGSTYRTRDEISGVRQERDPIERIRKLLLSHEIATEKELKGGVRRCEMLILLKKKQKKSREMERRKAFRPSGSREDKPLEQSVDMEKEARKQVDEAIAKAKESQMPEPSDLFTNVYVKGFGVEACGADRQGVRATLS
ncbi:hypothetical protein RJT34_01922 [Clitoria ternatea]|uniref:Dehydrogenase E1 component domain-containing protein n=1 Tax=Clitoria ternatea TaxID=43366 RepID=A0AAN9PYR2_CLITE